MRALAALACLAFAMLPAAHAQTILEAVQMEVRAGAFCAGPPDGTLQAPLTREGQISLAEQPYAIVREGDSLPGVVDLGIGLVVHLPGYGPENALTLQAQLLGVDRQPDIWGSNPDATGRIWFGRIPSPGARLD